MFFLPITHSPRAFNRPAMQHQTRSLEDSIDRLFGAETNPSRSPALDVAESDSAYTATLEMPGVAKENIQVSVEGRVVTVQAQVPPQVAAAEPATAALDSTVEATEAPLQRVVYRERSVARFARRFSLPADVELGETVAKLDHGVLTLTLPKRSVRNAANVTVN